ALALPSRSSVRLASGRQRVSGRLRAGRVDQWSVRRQLQLAPADLVSAQLPADRSAAEVPLLSRRGLPNRVSDGFGPHAQPVGDLTRALAPAGRAVSPRCKREATVQRRRRAVPNRSALARP